MSKIQCYIAQSIDGYIARVDDRIDWLENIAAPEGSDMGYSDFYAGIDTVIMGRKTYEQILSFDVPWPYAKVQSYVITTNEKLKVQTPRTSLVHELNEKWIEGIRTASNKNSWLIGGGSLVSEFMKLGALDELLLTIIPVVLGNGISLFPNVPPETTFRLLKTTDFGNDAVTLHYAKN